MKVFRPTSRSQHISSCRKAHSKPNKMSEYNREEESLCVPINDKNQEYVSPLTIALNSKDVSHQVEN